MLAESPLYQQWMAEKVCETRHAAIFDILEARFGNIPEVIATAVRSINDLALLKEATQHAALCKSIADFRKRITR